MGKRKGRSREASPNDNRASQTPDAESEQKSSVVEIYEIKPKPKRISAFSQYAKGKYSPENPDTQVVQSSEQKSDSRSSSPKIKRRKKNKEKRGRNGQNVGSSEQNSPQDEADGSTAGQSENHSDGEADILVIDSVEHRKDSASQKEVDANNDSVCEVDTDVGAEIAQCSPIHKHARGWRKDDQGNRSGKDGEIRPAGQCAEERSKKGLQRTERRNDRRDERRTHHISSHRPLDIRTFPVSEGNMCVLVTKIPEPFSVWGCASVRSLLGDVDVCGFLLRQGAESVDIFSPNSTSFVTIATTSPTSLTHSDITKSVGDLPGLSEDDKKQILAAVEMDSTVLVFAETTTKHRLDFVTSVPPFQQIFWSKENVGYNRDLVPLGLLPIAVVTDPGVKQIRISHEMKKVGEQFCTSIQKGEMPSVAVCGGKNVGKSTMCRYLTNSALNKCSQVAYLECDVGQTEYSPPGCVSLHLASVPVLGPPFTHQRPPHKMLYFGAVTPSDDPQFYLQCVKAAMTTYTTLEEPCPLIINTMGWNQGLGLIFLASTLSFTCPKYVIQIDSENRNRNLPPLTAQFVMEQDRWSTLEDDADEENPTHDLLKMHSVVDFHEFRDKYHPADHRTLSLLGYLSRYQPLSGPCTPLHALTPQTVAWGDVGVHVAHAAVPNAHIMYALNASIVGLCRVPDHILLSSDDDSLPKFLAEKPICECLGFGVVRAIDPDRKVFHIISDLSLAETGVNCLVRATLQVPHHLITKQPLVDDEIPYYGESKDVHGATAIKRRRHMMRRGRAGEHHKQ